MDFRFCGLQNAKNVSMVKLRLQAEPIDSISREIIRSCIELSGFNRKWNNKIR